MTNFRHEWKHEINFSDAVVIRQRLRAVAQTDAHAQGGRYEVRSLYFDTPTDTALREKIDGVNMREKFRIRFYNNDTSLIRLEKKRKCNGLTAKESAVLTREQAAAVAAGQYGWMAAAGNPLILELYAKIRADGLSPRTIVDYTREPFVYGPGNVRVTLDYHIRTGLGCTDFLNPECVMIPAGNAPMILEVKWDAFLPDLIREAVQLTGRRSCACSKYALCRIYG